MLLFLSFPVSRFLFPFFFYTFPVLYYIIVILVLEDCLVFFFAGGGGGIYPDGPCVTQDSNVVVHLILADVLGDITPRTLSAFSAALHAPCRRICWVICHEEPLSFFPSLSLSPSWLTRLGLAQLVFPPLRSTCMHDASQRTHTVTPSD